MAERAFRDWLEAVASGAATMSQRNLKWVEANGGLQELIAAAEQRGVHLVRLTDDKGNDPLAANQKPFQTLC